MKEFIKSALVTGLLFGAGWVIVLSPGFLILAIVADPLLSVTLAGLTFAFAGVPFGIAMTLLGSYLKKRFLAINLAPGDESLIHQGSANHFMGWEGVGGWLYLTDHALRFKSHEVNIQRHELTIALHEIVDAIPCRTLGVFPNGLRVITKDGQTERFVVSGRRQWTAMIIKAKRDAESQDGAAR